MSETAESLRRKIATAGDLDSVARTMKALAAASIGQYETAVRALNEYYRTVQLGLAACFRQTDSPVVMANKRKAGPKLINAVVFGSDQGLVGQFNDVLADFVRMELAGTPADKTVWAVGERIHARLADDNMVPAGLFSVPQSVNSITPLIGHILDEIGSHQSQDESAQLLLFYNRTSGAVYQPVMQTLLPLDEAWQQSLSGMRWPSRNLPQIIGSNASMVGALVREYIFISLFRACAESLASENASRLAAMQRAEKNIEELLADLNSASQRLRQSSIDEELFDVIAGYEMLAK